MDAKEITSLDLVKPSTMYWQYLSLFLFVWPPIALSFLKTLSFYTTIFVLCFSFLFVVLLFFNPSFRVSSSNGSLGYYTWCSSHKCFQTTTNIN